MSEAGLKRTMVVGENSTANSTKRDFASVDMVCCKVLGAWLLSLSWEELGLLVTTVTTVEFQIPKSKVVFFSTP